MDDCGILPGITRKIILRLAPYAGLGVQESKFDRDDLKGSEEVFITNSMIELVPVVRIDEKTIGSGRVGPVTRKIHNLYKETVKKEIGG